MDSAKPFSVKIMDAKMFSMILASHFHKECLQKRSLEAAHLRLNWNPINGTQQVFAL
jgi:hypothetical protein